MNHKIFGNAEFLNFSYLPEKLMFREKEYSRLLTNMKNCVSTFVCGPSGSGKTMLLKRAVSEINPGKIRAVYIDCTLYKTANTVLREILIDHPIASRSNYDLLKRLAERTRNNKIAVCLDHVEDLEEKETIGQLAQVGVCVVIASTRRDFLLTLDVKARISIGSLIQLKPYSAEQSLRILKTRADQALETGSYSDELISRVVNKINGNITIALNVLKTTAIEAENQNKKSLDEIELDDILLEHDCPSGLNADEKLILRILQEWKSLPASRLRDFYAEKSRHPKSERAFRNYMENLCTKGLVKALGEKRGRTYELVEGEASGQIEATGDR